jgi:ribosomal protein S18 acetylase RimI-like enzyme
MPLSYPSVTEFGLDQAAELLTRGFADYVVPIRLNAAALLAMIRQDSVDPGASRIVLDEGEPVGAALIARRGWTSRLAGMALIPESRARGIGEQLVRRLLAEAAGRGERAMTLEVIEQNARAVRLYERCGFRTDRRLVGFAGRPRVEAPVRKAEEVDIREVARALTAWGPADLPWQLSGETLAQAGAPGLAYRDGPAFVALSDPSGPTVMVRALVTEPASRRRGLATALLRDVMARHPDREWRVSAVWPEELGGVFAKLGLERTALTQWQMTAAVTPAGFSTP